MTNKKGPTKDDFEKLYQKYPKRPPGSNMGKATGMQRMRAKFKDWDAFGVLAKAVEGISKSVRDGQIEPEFVPMWSTFANRYEDYLPENLSDGSGVDSSEEIGLL